MSNKILYLEIVTPSKIVFSGNVQSVTVPGELGSFQILYNHAPIISNLVIGEIKFVNEAGETYRYVTNGGFVMVFKNRVTIVCDYLINSNEIDLSKTQAELSKLKIEIQEKRRLSDVEYLEKQIAFLENQIRVASK